MSLSTSSLTAHASSKVPETEKRKSSSMFASLKPLARHILANCLAIFVNTAQLLTQPCTNVLGCSSTSTLPSLNSLTTAASSTSPSARSSAMFSLENTTFTPYSCLLFFCSRIASYPEYRSTEKSQSRFFTVSGTVCTPSYLVLHTL